MHAARFLRGKRLDGTGVRVRHRGTPEQRFLQQVDKHGPVSALRPDLGACWLWTGTLTNNGYAGFNAQSQRSGHRWAYQHYVGPIPEGLQIDHLCRVRHCVNPAHLEAVTPEENVSRIPRLPVTHCSHGHEYTDENTWTDTRGNRFCRACNRERQRARKAANRKPRPITTHCPRGHEYTPENTYRYPDGRRSCKTCTRLRSRKGLARPRKPPF